MIRPAVWWSLTSIFVLTFVSTRVEASPSGYVYVPQAVYECLDNNPRLCGMWPQLLVLDASTAAPVVTIALPARTVTVGIAFSPDGRYLYVSNILVAVEATNSLTIIDARTHRIEATVAIPVAGRLAVSRDGSRVFILSSGLHAFDTATRSMVQSVAASGSDVGTSSSLDRVFVFDSLVTYAFDSRTLDAVGQVGHGARQRFRISRDGRRLFDAGFLFPCTSCGSGNATDAQTLAVGPSYPIFNDTVAPIELNAERLLNYGAGAQYTIDPGTGNVDQFASVPGLGFIRNFTLPSPGTTAFVLQDPGPATAHSPVTLATVNVATATLAAVSAPLVPEQLLISTPWGADSCTYRLDSHYASFIEVPAAGVPVRLTTDCAWSASVDAPWIHLSNETGASGGAVTITVDNNFSGQTRQGRVVIGGQIVTVTQAGTASQPGFGVIDTPADFATGISGALNVTGWALDDVGVAAVRLYRDPVAGEPLTLIPLGTATLVEGARPDVQAVFPTSPFASRAGWGYQLLTNMLPGGDGTFRLHAYVEDLEGHATPIGSRTVTVKNSTASLPFGALDTPGPGETVAGVITNWGWALTPPDGSIPLDGSTIDVIVDGLFAGHPTFGLDRPDIAALFPGYANTNSAVGYLTIDTTTLTNGVHTIAWVVRDSLGRAQGIGSRYFTVRNP